MPSKLSSIKKLSSSVAMLCSGECKEFVYLHVERTGSSLECSIANPEV